MHTVFTMQNFATNMPVPKARAQEAAAGDAASGDGGSSKRVMSAASKEGMQKWQDECKCTRECLHTMQKYLEHAELPKASARVVSTVTKELLCYKPAGGFTGKCFTKHSKEHQASDEDNEAFHARVDLILRSMPKEGMTDKHRADCARCIACMHMLYDEERPQE